LDLAPFCPLALPLEVGAGLIVGALDEAGNPLAEEAVDLTVLDWEGPYSPLVKVDCDDGEGTKAVQYLGRTRASQAPYGALRLVASGAAILARVLTPTEYRYSRWMLPPEVKDTSSLIESPMPGVLVSLAVQKGQEMELGQEVAVVEAMKMQNVLRAPRAGRVAEVHARPGDTLLVDQLIISMEEPAEDPNQQGKIAA